MARSGSRTWRERKLPFLVAEAGGTVAGYAYASPWRPKPAYRHTVEDSVYLAPGQRGRGLGRLLLESLLTGCADAGVRQVIAVIADSGDPASVALHRACGFAETGRLSQVGYKHGRWLDTVLLQREPQPGEYGRGVTSSRFVVQLHDATTLHFDLRLQVRRRAPLVGGPRGPSLDPAVRRLAVPGRGSHPGRG